MTRTSLLFSFVLALVVTTSGCSSMVTNEAIDTAKTTAAGCDRYTTLTIKALKGEATLESDGIASVSKEQLAKTPAPVRGLILRLLG